MPTVRYLVSDVGRSIAFYTRHLGFKLEQQMSSASDLRFRNEIVTGP